MLNREVEVARFRHEGREGLVKFRPLKVLKVLGFVSTCFLF